MADAMKLLPCPFCGEALRMRLGSNAYGHCATKGCHSHRAQIVPLDDARQVEAWNRRASPPAREEDPAEGAGDARAIMEMIVADLGLNASGMLSRAGILAMKIAALRNRTSEPEAGEAAGCAELEVGRAVYERIEKLIDATSGPEAVELCYLAHLVESVEEVGGYDGPHPDRPAPATADKLRVAREALEKIADEAPYRSGYCQSDIEYGPKLSDTEMQAEARQALTALNEQPQ